MTVSNEVLIAAFGSMGAFAAAIVWWTLKRAEKIQDSALDRWKEQTAALETVKESIREVGTSLSRHDELNGIAHKEAASILKDTAKVLERIHKEDSK
jgi:3-mercaptopyruvate sulfurtransferase SseA